MAVVGCADLARANVPMPPSRAWFALEFEHTVDLRGIQLIRCENDGCEQPALVGLYGRCGDDARLADAGLRYPFDCAGGRCLYEYRPFDADKEMAGYQIFLCFQNAVHKSNWFSLDNSESGGWTVRLAGGVLTVTPDAGFFYQKAGYDGAWAGFALTLIAELLVAAFFRAAWLSKNAQNAPSWPHLLAAVALADVISYPVVWFVLPSLGQFQPDGVRRFGYWIAVLVVIYGFGLTNIIATSPGRRRRVKIWGLVAGSVVLAVVSCIVLFLVFYGNYRIAVHGLPAGWVILLSEVFAICFEMVLMYRLLKGKMSLTQVFVLSLCMNAASYLAGGCILKRW